MIPNILLKIWEMLCGGVITQIKKETKVENGSTMVSVHTYNLSDEFLEMFVGLG